MVVRFIGLNSVKFREQEVDQIRTLIIYDLVVILNRINYEKKIFFLGDFPTHFIYHLYHINYFDRQ